MSMSISRTRTRTRVKFTTWQSKSQTSWLSCCGHEPMTTRWSSSRTGLMSGCRLIASALTWWDRKNSQTHWLRAAQAREEKKQCTTAFTMSFKYMETLLEDCIITHYAQFIVMQLQISHLQVLVFHKKTLHPTSYTITWQFVSECHSMGGHGREAVCAVTAKI